eukprot:GHVN01011508.1.p1 GENE.GHVN01011508.1~~GHVN01011508.1.p1  ORF type:complete len:106 (-),score=15.25 GHVN01011508.1:211-528(-)
MTLGGNTNTCSFNVVDEKVPVLISFPQQRKLKLVIDCERMVVSAKGMPEEIDIIYLAEESREDQDVELMGEEILEERSKEVLRIHRRARLNLRHGWRSHTPSVSW